MTEEDAPRPRRLPLFEIIVIAVILGLAVSPLIIALLSGTSRREQYKVSCTSNLVFIYHSALSYSDRSGTRAFPIAPGPNPKAHESLNVMIRFDRRGLEPRLFLCPSGEAIAAKVDADGRFALDAHTSSYAWTAQPINNNRVGPPLASDKYVQGYRDRDGVHGGHSDGMNVLYTDGSVQWVPASDLPRDTMLPEGLSR